MATLYNNGTGNQSMGNMGAGMAAAYADWQKAQLEGDPLAAKRASENYQKAEALKADPNRDIARAEKVGKENSDREINKQQEKNRKEQEEKARLPEKLEPDTTSPNIINVSNDNTEHSLYEEYGNNYFELITYDNIFKGKGNPDGTLTLAGVLKDIPSFGLTTEWDKGPAASISDTVKNFMCSPTMEMVTTLGGHDRSWMNLDEGTDRTYKTTSRPSFDLTFKLYTNENIGSKSLTTYQTWLKALSLYAMPSVDAKVSINAMANNTLNGVYGCVDLADQMIDAAKKTFNTSMNDKDKDFLDTMADVATNVVNTAADAIESRNGEWRVSSNNNLKNYYGAKLWYLKILPGIFRKPLIVYISNWGITYSKEINPNTGKPIWVEFKINCQMDQIASAPIWMKYLRNTT